MKSFQNISNGDTCENDKNIEPESVKELGTKQGKEKIVLRNPLEFLLSVKALIQNEF